jgi:DNA-binding PadR family transcriptional regulator
MGTGDFPLSEASFLILASISQEPLHGYAIIKRVEALSTGRLRLSTGTLFGSIQRFLRLGWIERRDNPESSSGRKKKVYRLTGGGRRAFQAEAERLKSLVAVAEASIPGRTLAGSEA